MRLICRDEWRIGVAVALVCRHIGARIVQSNLHDRRHIGVVGVRSLRVFRRNPQRPNFLKRLSFVLSFLFCLCLCFRLCLCFSFSSRLIVLVEVARVEEAGSSGKVSLSEGDRIFRRSWLLMRGGQKASPIGDRGLAINAGSGLCHQGRGCAVKAMLCRQGKDPIKAGSRRYHPGKSGVVLSRQVPSRRFLGSAAKAGAIKAESDSVHGWRSRQWSSWLWVVSTLLTGQVWVRSLLCR